MWRRLWHIVLAALVVYAAAGLYAALMEAQRTTRMSGCHDNLADLAVAMRAYAGDYGGAYPPGDAWCGALLAGGLTDPAELVCPSLPRERCGYARSVAITRTLPGAAKAHERGAVLLFDGPGGWNATGALGDVAFRHKRRAFVLFDGGRVKCVSRAEALALAWDPPSLPPSAPAAGDDAAP
jgi:hypothetical protein